MGVSRIGKTQRILTAFILVLLFIFAGGKGVKAAQAPPSGSEQVPAEVYAPSSGSGGSGGTDISDNSSTGQLQLIVTTSTFIEKTGNATLTVTCQNSQNSVVKVTYETTGGTATAGSDYNTTTGTLIFNPGETTKTFTIPILDDSAFEGEETIIITLSPFIGEINLQPFTAVLKIIDNDPNPEAPQLKDASIYGPVLELTFDKALDDTSIPALSSFMVRVNGSPVNLAKVEMDWKTMNLTLGRQVLPTEQVTLDYTVPALKPIQDLKGNRLSNIRGCPVANYTFLVGEEIRITKPSSSQHNPTINQNNIVWVDHRNNREHIYLYDFTTDIESRVIPDTIDQWNPLIYQDKILCFGGDLHFNDGDLYLYDLSLNKKTQITSRSRVFNASIYGNIVVWDQEGTTVTSSGSLNRNIWMYDHTTGLKKQISTVIAHQVAPEVYQDKIVWADDRDGNTSIYMYDLITKKEVKLFGNYGNQGCPKIYGDNIIWVNSNNIFIYNIATRIQNRLTDDESVPSNPDIYGNKVVWQDNRYGDSDIFMFDLDTGIEYLVTTDLSEQTNPKIYGNKVVWQDNRNGNLDIYMMYLDTFPPFIAKTIPAGGASKVQYKQAISINFNEDIWKSINFDDITLKEGNSVVSFTYSLNENRLVLTPENNLASGTTYTVTIPAKAVMDYYGNDLAENYSFSFTTQEQSTGSPGGGGGGGTPEVNPPAVPSLPKAKTFQDLVNHWAQKDIEELAAKGIVKGQTDYLFAPENIITRAEFTALLVRALNLPTTSEDCPFKDILAGDWYSEVLKTAYNNGLVTGNQGYFHPHDKITREEMIVMLVRALEKVAKKPIQVTSNNSLSTFKDYQELSLWAKDALLKAVSLELIKGKEENKLAPRTTATRAEGVVLIKRLLTLI